VILEDDELDLDLGATAVSASVDAGANPAFELSKLVHPLSYEVWYDVEDNRYVDEDLRPFPLLE
jgi:hypothetical protein